MAGSNRPAGPTMVCSEAMKILRSINCVTRERSNITLANIMPLTAPRFIGDSILESCLAGTHRMLSPESGPAVTKVQEALIDLGLLGPKGADGHFGTPTGSAVVAFKTTRSIFPNDPVVGPKTMTALDLECANKPPAPFTDRNEWVSWRDRGNVAHVGLFNFTRADELARRSAGKSFTFDTPSSWLPAPLQTALTASLSALLNPHGSPNGNGVGFPPATWGVGPFDLYHCHLVLWAGPGGIFPRPPTLMNNGEALDTQVKNLYNRAAAVPGALKFNLAWANEFRTLLPASGLLPQFGALASAAVTAATAVQPLLLVWHSFEFQHSRPAGMTSGSLQRHWQTQVAPTLIMPTPFAFVDHTMSSVTHKIFDIAFFISKTGVITAMPGAIGLLEAASMAGLTWDEVDKAQSMIA